MAKQASRTPRAASLSEEQRALATAIITDAIVAARQSVAAPPQVPAPAPLAITAADQAAAEYVAIKRALRTHSEPAATSTAALSSPNPSTAGLKVTFTATVTPSSASGAPTGTVTFMDGATPLATDTLNALSQASVPIAFGVGSYSITAVYSGDGNFTGSTSLAVIQIVN